MRKHMMFLSLLIALMLTAAACGGGNTDNAGEQQQGNENQQEQENEANQENNENQQVTDLLMGTGSKGGTYFPLGSEMANVWNNNIENVNVTATDSDASLENLAKIGRGEYDLGMTVHIPALNAYNGEGNFEGAKVENFAFIGHIYPEIMQVVTREATGINSIADLKGKKVAIGPPGSGTQAAAKLILEAHGIKDGDYQAYQEGFGDAKTKLQDGVIDASFGFLGVPNSGIDELQAATKDVKFLEIEGEALQYIEENSGYKAYTIGSGSYEWQNDDVNTISAFAILVANTDTVNDDLAYQLAKTMIEKRDENTHSQAKFMTEENALKGSEGLPIHPGAENTIKKLA